MDGLKTMRAELGLSQTELAAALGVSFTAINRWENNKARPGKTTFANLVRYAREQGVSGSCIEVMQNSFELSRTRQNSDRVRLNGMLPIDRELLYQLVEEAETAVYVTDVATDELLYVNRALETAVGKKRNGLLGCKCYKFLADRDSPCPCCNKSRLTRDGFYQSPLELPHNGQLYTSRAKEITWNGRIAHVRYLTSINSEQVLRHVPCGICIYTVNSNRKLKLKYANDSYYALCGGSKEQVEQAGRRDPLSGVCAEDRASMRSFIDKIIEQRKSGEQIYRAAGLERAVRWICVHAAYAPGDSALKDRLYCTLTDVTQNVSNELHLKSILSNTPVAMIVFEVRNRRLYLKYISESCINISGFTAQETYLRNADGRASDAHPDARKYFVEHQWDDIQTKQNLCYTYQISCRDGSLQYVNLSLAPVLLDGVQLYYGALRRVEHQSGQSFSLY